MIQRIQTVYLAIAVLLLIICGCLPIGTFLPEGMGSATVMYNLCLIDGNGSWSFVTSGLFALLTASTICSVIAIFGFNNRKVQCIDCLCGIICLLLWMGLYALHVTVFKPEHTEYHFGYASLLPVFAIVLQGMARRAIKKDEELIRSVDRIR